MTFENYLLPPWLLFMVVVSVVAMVASFFMFRSNNRRLKNLDARAAAKKAAARKREVLNGRGETDLRAHGLFPITKAPCSQAAGGFFVGACELKGLRILVS